MTMFSTAKKRESSDCAELRAQGISAVQWDGKEGHIEYIGHKKPNEMITSFTRFQKYFAHSTPLIVKPIGAPPATREEFEEMQRRRLKGN